MALGLCSRQPSLELKSNKAGSEGRDKKSPVNIVEHQGEVFRGPGFIGIRMGASVYKSHELPK
jgi:hypothetical protein